jgi:flagellar basal body-associated protein FliL
VSNANTEAEKLALLEKARQDAAYRLDDTIRTNSIDKAKRAVTCSGLLYATVEDATAQKELDFKEKRLRTGRCPFRSVRFNFSHIIRRREFMVVVGDSD